MSKIVVVEDEEILRTLVEKELTGAGHEVRTAVNGEEAWALLEEETPDILLSDLLMPLMNGYDLLVRIRADERFKELPCLVLSNSGQINDLNRAYECGANDVLIKTNFNPEQLEEKVRQLLAAKDGGERTMPI